MMRRTGLKEMSIVRYADDFRIFCRNREEFWLKSEQIVEVNRQFRILDKFNSNPIL